MESVESEYQLNGKVVSALEKTIDEVVKRYIKAVSSWHFLPCKTYPPPYIWQSRRPVLCSDNQSTILSLRQEMLAK